MRAWIGAGIAVALAGAAAAQGVPPDVSRRLWEGGTEIAAAGLARAIRDGAAEAERAGLAPVPAAIRAALAGEVPDAVLQQVRWGVAVEGTPAMRLLFASGRVAAVTLGRTILFQDAAAAADPALWAHELAHVMQYEALGIDGFARAYVADARAMEAEAVRAARDWAAGRARSPRPVQRP